jgi:beta-lactamase class A
VKPIEKIHSIFERYTSSYHFYLKDLRTGEDFELGVKKRYPICSCFKLAALISLFDGLTSEKQLNETFKIQKEYHKNGGGILPFIPGELIFSLEQIAHLMMAFSDATATSLVESKVDKGAINAVLAQCTLESRSDLNLGEMITELFDGLKCENNRKDNLAKIGKKLIEKNSYSNALDLALLAEYSYSYKPNSNLMESYKRILRAPRYNVRTDMFFNKNVTFIGKTGSIGFGFFINDCGIIEYDGKPIALLGYMTEGWSVARELAEIECGRIGLLIGEVLDLDFASDRWSNETEVFLER